MPHETGLKRAKTGGMAIHTVRTKNGPPRALKYGRKQAIALMCTECLGWEDHPRDCTSVLCPLYPFRAQTRASRN